MIGQRSVVKAGMALAFVSLLSGCASLDQSAEELRADPHQKGTVSFADPYSVVFANVTASANKCFPTRPLSYGPGYLMSATAAHMSVELVELEPGKLGRMEAITTGLGKNVFLSMDIRSTPSGTGIDYYIGKAFFGTYDNSSRFEPIAIAWAQGDATKCD